MNTLFGGATELNVMTRNRRLGIGHQRTSETTLPEPCRLDPSRWCLLGVCQVNDTSDEKGGG